MHLLCMSHCVHLPMGYSIFRFSDFISIPVLSLFVCLLQAHIHPVENTNNTTMNSRGRCRTDSYCGGMTRNRFVVTGGRGLELLFFKGGAKHLGSMGLGCLQDVLQHESEFNKWKVLPLHFPIGRLRGVVKQTLSPPPLIRHCCLRVMKPGNFFGNNSKFISVDYRVLPATALNST